MRWSEVVLTKESGVFEFHSHTHTHTRWDKTDPSYKNTHIQRELAQSRETLQGRLGAVSEHFCWPQGYFDADYVRLAKEAGFKYLYTTQAFGQNTPGMDPANIYRFAVRDTHGASVGRRIKVAAHPVIGPIFNAFKRWKRARRVR
jgi:peptidoglycan/xylan/chitin deacetylase (PgdA/CDA1 family)